MHSIDFRHVVITSKLNDGKRIDLNFFLSDQAYFLAIAHTVMYLFLGFVICHYVDLGLFSGKITLKKVLKSLKSNKARDPKGWKNDQ